MKSYNAIEKGDDNLHLFPFYFIHSGDQVFYERLNQKIFSQLCFEPVSGH